MCLLGGVFVFKTGIKDMIPRKKYKGRPKYGTLFGEKTKLMVATFVFFYVIYDVEKYKGSDLCLFLWRKKEGSDLLVLIYIRNVNVEKDKGLCL